jgi:hypothetical protein
MYIKVADADKGILRVSWAESADGDFKLTGSDVYIRRQGHWLLASMPWPGGDGYWWARIEIFPAEEYRSEGSLVIWAPSGGRTSLGGSDLVETDPEWIVWMQATNDSTGTLWKIPTLYERIKLDGFEPGSGQRSAPGKDAPKD